MAFKRNEVTCVYLALNSAQYNTPMKNHNDKGKIIIIGGLFFLIPFLALVIIAFKGFKMFLPVGSLVVDGLHIHSIFGAATLGIVTILVIVLLSYLFGLFIMNGFMKRYNDSIEEKLFIFFPNFQMIKYQLLGNGKNPMKESWKAIVVEDEGKWCIGFITGETDTHLSIFLPDAPRISSGQVFYKRKDEARFTEVPMSVAMSSLSKFGKGELMDCLP